MPKTKKILKKIKEKTSKKKNDHTLRDLLVHKLQALYDIESELVKALPKMAAAASDQNLKQGFRDHLDETRNQVCRIETAFEILGEKPKKLKVDAIRGLISDGIWVMRNVRGEEALDANLIAAARFIEHYEMAGYMAAKQWAEILDEDKLVEIFDETLEEEMKADEILESASILADERARLPETLSETEE